jgi:hypothetical protein
MWTISNHSVSFKQLCVAVTDTRGPLFPYLLCALTPLNSGLNRPNSGRLRQWLHWLASCIPGWGGGGGAGRQDSRLRWVCVLYCSSFLLRICYVVAVFPVQMSR